MKPYKLASTWIDLDHVLAVQEEVDWTPWMSHWINGVVTLAFRDKPLFVSILKVEATYNPEDGNRMMPEYTFNQDDIASAKAQWEAFKTAWKTKDTMFGSSKT